MVNVSSNLIKQGGVTMWEARYLTVEMIIAINTLMTEQGLNRLQLSHILCMSYPTIMTALNRSRKVSKSNVEKFVNWLAEYGVIVENPTVEKDDIL